MVCYVKSSILCFLFVSVFVCGKSQDSTITLSGFEKFINKPGTVIKTEMRVAGQYGSNKVLKYIVTDMTTGEHTYAVRIDDNYSFDFPTELTDSKALYIDSADLPSFIATAESFLKASDGTQLSFDTQYSYFTSADVKLSCYFVKFSNNWGFAIDKVFQKLRTHIPETSFVLSRKRMQQLIAILKQSL